MLGPLSHHYEFHTDQIILFTRNILFTKMKFAKLHSCKLNELPIKNPAKEIGQNLEPETFAREIEGRRSHDQRTTFRVTLVKKLEPHFFYL